MTHFFNQNDLSFLCVCSFSSSPVLRRLQMSKFIFKSILVIDCKTIYIFVYSSTREQTKGLEQEWKWRDWDWGEALIFLLPLHTPIRCALETTNLFTDFEKKNNCFAVYIGEDVMWLSFNNCMKLNCCRYLGGHSSAQQNEIAPVIQWAVKPHS